MIAKGTTPIIRVTFSVVNVSDIKVAYLTVNQGRSTIIEKDLDTATIGKDYIEWQLTQEETLNINEHVICRIQCRYKTADNGAYASKIYECKAQEILKEGVI